MENCYSEKTLSGYKIRKIVRDRLKVLAKMNKTSVSDIVDKTLYELTKDIRTPEEIEEEKNKTQEFLDCCVGKWEGPDFDESIKAINLIRTINEPIKL